MSPETVLPWRERLEGEAMPTAPWTPGSFWTYQATFKSGRSLDVALVVHRAEADAYHLGTNLSAGFFGLPFNGTVSRGHLNPVIGDEEWRLYEFPLVSGKSWEYDLFGHRVRTVVRGATIGLPDGTREAGFELESTAYGRTFARYTYAPEVGWFTRLTLYEPTDGRTVLDVRLTGAGENFGRDYFVQEPLERVRHEYPTLDRADELRLPAGARVQAVLTLRGEAGDFQARLLSPRGAPVVDAAVHGQGAAIDRATFTATGGAWELAHLGVGKGTLRLELTAIVSAVGSGAVAPESDERSDLLGLIAAPAGSGEKAPLLPLD